MRVPRFWRMKQQQYRLMGTQHQNGAVSVIARPEPLTAQQLDENIEENTTVEVAA